MEPNHKIHGWKQEDYVGLRTKFVVKDKCITFSMPWTLKWTNDPVQNCVWLGVQAFYGTDSLNAKSKWLAEEQDVCWIIALE